MADYTGNDAPNTYTGTGDPETIRGEGGDDVLDGAGGDDKIYGGAGRDEVHGGAGNDKLYVELSTHIVAGEIYDGGDGFDTLYLLDPNFSRYDLSGVTLTSIEELSGVIGPDHLIVRMTAAQADGFSLFSASDTIIQLTTGGSVSLAGDHVTGYLSFTLADVSSVFDARGVINDGTVSVRGGAAGDLIYGADHGYTGGGGGNDVLIGGTFIDGGTGADRMYGTNDDNVYYVDQQDDVIFESAEGSNGDSVQSTASFYLYANVELLTLMGSDDLFGVGNADRNILAGNSGNNLLIGGGGDDSLYGGNGNDVLFGQTGTDILAGDDGNDYLAGGDGDDYLLGDNGGDALYGEDGNDQLFGGNDFVYDLLVGGAGHDALHGDSGLGDYDAMYGNTGDDVYYVDTGDDLTFEQPGEGTDTVFANVAGTNNGVYLYANIERLYLLGTTAFGVGNELDNQIVGNDVGNTLLGGAGDDSLYGKGGNDILFGQAGADQFVFERGMGVDTVGDFVPGTDKIVVGGFGYSWQQIVNSLHENNGNTAIDMGQGDIIVLLGVTAAQLHQSDFAGFTGAAVEPPLETAAVQIAAPYGTAVTQDGTIDAPLWALIDPVSASGLWA